MTVVVRPLERALRALRARFLGVAVLDGILAGISAGVAVFLTGVILHAFGGLSYSARIVSLVLSVIAFAGVFSAVFWARGIRRCSLEGLAARAEVESKTYGGVLVAAAEMLKSSAPRDAVADALLADADKMVAEKPPSIEYKPSGMLMKATVAIFLLGPIIPFAAGPGRFALAVVDCLFPEREALFGAVARFESVEPGSGDIPAEQAMDIKVNYFGWPPKHADLRVVDSRGERMVALTKVRPGLFLAKAVFPKGLVEIQPSAVVPIIEGTKEIVGEEIELRAVPVARIIAVSQRIELPFAGFEPVLAGGGDVVAPAGAKVSVTVTADVPLKSLRIAGVEPQLLIVEGENARFSFLVEGPGGYSIRPVPAEGYEGEMSSFRIVPTGDSAPVVTNAVVENEIKVVVSDDWGIGKVALTIEPPEGGKRTVDLYEGGARTVKKTLPIGGLFAGGKSGKYLVRAVASDTATPNPHMVEGPLLTIEYTPPEQEDPLLASLPQRPQRYLNSEPPKEQQTPPSKGEEPPKLPPKQSGGDRKLEGLGGGAQGNETSGNPPPGKSETKEPPKYASMPNAPNEQNPNPEPGKENGGGNAGSKQGENPPPSSPEGGLAGTGEKGGSAGGKPGETGSGGVGRPSDGAGGKPVDGGRPTGNETGPTEVFRETVDKERVESVDVKPDEVKGVALNVPPNKGSGKELEDAERAITADVAASRLGALELERVPEVYRNVVRLYWEKAGGKGAAR
jgi:hypothetical protein